MPAFADINWKVVGIVVAVVAVILTTAALVAGLNGFLVATGTIGAGAGAAVVSIRRQKALDAVKAAQASSVAAAEELDSSEGRVADAAERAEVLVIVADDDEKVRMGEELLQ